MLVGEVMVEGSEIEEGDVLFIIDLVVFREWSMNFQM